MFRRTASQQDPAPVAFLSSGSTINQSPRSKDLAIAVSALRCRPKLFLISRPFRLRLPPKPCARPPHPETPEIHRSTAAPLCRQPHRLAVRSQQSRSQPLNRLERPRSPARGQTPASTPPASRRHSAAIQETTLLHAAARREATPSPPAAALRDRPSGRPSSSNAAHKIPLVLLARWCILASADEASRPTPR